MRAVGLGIVTKPAPELADRRGNEPPTVGQVKEVRTQRILERWLHCMLDSKGTNVSRAVT
jgi:hypothetical protein